MISKYMNMTQKFVLFRKQTYTAAGTTKTSQDFPGMLKCYSASKTQKEKKSLKFLFNKLRKFVKARKKKFFLCNSQQHHKQQLLTHFFCICFSWHRCYVKRG